MVKLPKDELDFLKRSDDINDSKKDGKLIIFNLVSFYIEPIFD